MSTQDGYGVEFSIIPEEHQQHFRLLELPAGLLAVLTSQDPPILQLKSQEGPPGHTLESNAVVCTLDKTYTLRQVSTSNEVYVTQPVSASSEVLFHPGLEAIGHCNSTLEVQPLENPSAASYIKAALPTYSSTGHYDSKDVISKKQLRNIIPLSDLECDEGWLEAACFELGDPPRGLVPSDGTRLNVWRSISEAATAMSVDLTERLDMDDPSRIASSIKDWPHELSIAVLTSMMFSISHAGVRLNDTRCAQVVGQMLLKEKTHVASQPVLLSSFKSEWADLLPEKWRGKADINLLKGCCRLENGGKEIIFVDDGVSNGTAANTAAPEDAKSTLGAKRKWHEKFRASKKAA